MYLCFLKTEFWFHDFFLLLQTPVAAHTNNGFNGINMRSAAERSERAEMPNHHLASPPPSLPNSQPPTREGMCIIINQTIFQVVCKQNWKILTLFCSSLLKFTQFLLNFPLLTASPAPLMMAQNARTPPPKRWKRSFDMAHPSATRKDAIPSSDQPLSLVSLSHLDNAS